MQQQNQKLPGDQITMRGTFNLLYFLARAHATCFTVFTRHTFGEEALGWNGLGAFVLILLYAGFANSGGMLTFFCLWLLALIVQRARTTAAVRRGAKLHSQSGGYPWLGYSPQFVKSYRGAMLIEYLVVQVAGALLCSVSEPIGMFTVVGSWSMLFVYGVERQAWLMEARRMRDAEIEMRARTDFYQGNGNDF